MSVQPYDELVETLKRAAEQARIVRERAAETKNIEPITLPEVNPGSTAKPVPKA